MRLTCVLRKRSMNNKPLSYMKNMYWNNNYYLQQERKVWDFKFKENMERDNLPVFKIDDILTPVIPVKPVQHFTNTVTREPELIRDQSHPLWKDEPAFTYRDNTWMAKDCELAFAQAATNTIAVDSLPQNLLERQKDSSEEVKYRVEDLIRSCYIGDAVQKALPKDFEVPFIGWHPVESKMRPRNQYDWTKMSWGRNPKREYGVPNRRKLSNLCLGLVKEACKSSEQDLSNYQLLEHTKMRQFIRRPDGKLVRFFLSVPLVIASTTSQQPLPAPPPDSIIRPEYTDTLTKDRVRKGDSEGTPFTYNTSGVPDTHPLNPVNNFFQDHIYEHSDNFPITSKEFSHPHVHSVFYYNDAHIKKRYSIDKERSKCLIYAYTTALGQARLLQGDSKSLDLKEPITINSISTNGQLYTASSFQLNSLDLESTTPNYFHFHAEQLPLFDFCGYVDGQDKLEGVNMDTYKILESVLTSNSRSKETARAAAVQ